MSSEQETHKVIVLPGAEAGMRNTYDYYWSLSPELAEKFLLSIEEAFNTIALYPLLFQVKYLETRIAFTAVFPYAVHFQLNSMKKEIIIGGFYHQHQKKNRTN